METDLIESTTLQSKDQGNSTVLHLQQCRRRKSQQAMKAATVSNAHTDIGRLVTNVPWNQNPKVASLPPLAQRKRLYTQFYDLASLLSGTPGCGIERLGNQHRT